MEQTRDRLAEVAADALLVFGADDPALASDFTPAPARPARSLLIPDAGHYPFAEQPHTFHHLLLPYLGP